MLKNEEGEDTVIANFNNWYFPISNLSGFIFWDYYYQIDLEQYEGATCYFVIDDQVEMGAGFSFIHVDEIVTYYAQNPELTGYLKAGYVTNPEA